MSNVKTTNVETKSVNQTPKPQSNIADISAIELLGLNVLNADTEIARHNATVAAHSPSAAATSSTRSFDEAGATPNNFIPLMSVTSRKKASLDLDAVREKLKGKSGSGYWQSLEQLASEPEFQDLVDREFGRQSPASWEPLSRRDFLKVMGAGLALAGLAGCAYQPQEKIVPYVKAPEEMVPGKPLFYATAMPIGGGYVNGALAESNMGRPTKIEGNPEHPASLGASDVFMQAAVLGMYDPERLQDVTFRGNPSTWNAFAAGMQAERDKHAANGGAGLRVLTDGVTSPTLVAQIEELLRVYPNARWTSYESVNSDNANEGARLAFGEVVEPIYRFDQAQRILSLDSDFLFESAGRVRYGRDFIKGRKVSQLAPKEAKSATMNRLYVVESTATMTGAMADHRLPMKASEILELAQTILREVQVISGTVPPSAATPSVSATRLKPNVRKWITAVAKDLSANRGKSLIVAGATQPAAVHVLAHAMNSALGNVGKTVYYTAPVVTNATAQTASLRNLVSDLNKGRVTTLMVLGGNPVYDAPADLRFQQAIEKFAQGRNNTIIRLGMHGDETSQWAHWLLPATHALEMWSDGRAFDGTTSIVQPLIEPLYPATHSPHEVLAVFLNAPVTSGLETVRTLWSNKLGLPQGEIVGSTGAATQAVGGEMQGGVQSVTVRNGGITPFEKAWQTILHDGTIPNTASPAKAVTLNVNAVTAATSPATSSTRKGNKALEITFRPDPTLWDGRWANNGWLQELPKPLTRLTWDNAAMMSLNTARGLGVTNNDLVQLKTSVGEVTAPVYVLPGQPDGSITVHLGGGRQLGGRVLEGIGFNANLIRSSATPTIATNVQVTKVAGYHKLASVSDHHVISTADKKRDAEGKANIDSTFGRDIIRIGDLDKFREDPRFLHGEWDRYIDYGEDVEGDQNEKSGKSGKAKGEEGLPTLYNNGWPSDPKGIGKDGVPIYTDPKNIDPKNPNKGILSDEPSRNRYNDPHVQFGYNGEPMPQWAMTIDLQSCIGCNACTIGCQAENNIATVGRDQVLKTREMHWIRIDTYFRGDVDNPEAYFQPVPCMNCEKAPCEPVCPVEATTHSAEGINEMTYNRCVGTKYCSNNCPYKVRRFNFLQYSDLQTPQIKLMKNPDVTTRARGVMEKCNYCVQRVTQARIGAENEGRPMRDGEILTACQQACPTDAIMFGNLADMKSEVRRSKAHPLNYAVLAELGTQPRTTYLARLRNLNPEMKTLEPGRYEAGENHEVTGHEDNADGPISPTARENGNGAGSGLTHEEGNN